MTNTGEYIREENLVAGRNAVLELLKTDAEVECIYLQRESEGTLKVIAAQAKDKNIMVKNVGKAKLDDLVSLVPHQGVVAQLAYTNYNTLEDIFSRAGDNPPFIIIADGIEDPHNLGAIIRTAEGAGAHGVIIPKRRSAGVTFVVAKTSAGAVAHMPVVKVSNLVNTIKELKKRGIWFYGSDMEGKSWYKQDFKGGVGLVIGAEDKGISRLVREQCDFMVSLPMLGQVSSLNASVAAGIVMYEIVKQRIEQKNLN